jgi:hypothetical protein
MQILVHLGFNKCASTYIQRALAAAQAGLRRHGVFYPVEGGRPAQYGLSRQYGFGPDVDGVTPRSLLWLMAEAEKRHCTRLIVSSEYLSLCRPAAIAAFADDLEALGADAHFLSFSREITAWLRSLFNQYVRAVDSGLAPGARFLHVMRDPRSIAWSLQTMRWGPDELTTAARWVDSYCRAWTAAEARAARLGVPLIRLHIEEAAAAPAEAGAWLTAQLGLAPRDGLLLGADVEVLNRWAAKADPAERARLDTRLGGWVAHFGYDPVRIGWRPSPSLPLSPALTPAAGRNAGPEAA